MDMENSPENVEEQEPIAATQEEVQVDPKEEYERQLKEKDAEIAMYRRQIQNTPPPTQPAAPQKHPLMLEEGGYVDATVYNNLVGELQNVTMKAEKALLKAAHANLRSRYDDYDKVINKKSIAEFEQNNQSMAGVVGQSQADHEDKLETLYLILKGKSATQERKPQFAQSSRKTTPMRSPQMMPTSSQRMETYSSEGKLSREMEEQLLAEMEPHLPAHVQGQRRK